MTQALTVSQLAVAKLAQWSGLLTKQQLTSITARGWGWGGWLGIRESYTGAWQQNVTIELANVLSHPTVFACITLIASDIAKMGLWLVELTPDGIWRRTDSPAFSPVLRRPNKFQTRIEFIRSWVISLLVVRQYLRIARARPAAGGDRDVCAGRHTRAGAAGA